MGWEADAARSLHASVWINDRLDTTAEHVECIKATGLPVVTFDDRGTGAQLSDLNVAALVFEPEEIARLQGERLLIGVNHLILDPAIAHFRRARTHITSVLVSLGGADTYGATVKVVRLLRDKHVDAIASIDARLAALEGNVSMAWQSVATTATAASAVQRG